MSEAVEITQPESRIKKVLKNVKVNLIFYGLTLILTFFSRKIFLDSLGASFVGLTGSLSNLLQFLNLAELGISTAIGVSLYKPLYNKDYGQVCEIVSVMGYLYRWIGTIILSVGIIVSFFIPVIFPVSETGFSLPLVYFGYYAFLTSSLIGYFVNYRQILIGADQREYITASYYQTTNIIKTILQLFLAYYTGSYFLWFAIELSFGILYSIVLNKKINQVFPWLKTNLRQGKTLLTKYPSVATYTKQLFVHKLSSFVQYETTPFLIYSFVNLTVVAFYQNYTLIIDKVATVFMMLLTGSGASVGNLIAEGNKDKIIKVYWEIYTVQLFTTSILCFMIAILINPFISLWLGGKYLLGKTVLVLIIIRTFIGQTRGANECFLAGYGLFKDIWAAFADVLIYLCVAIVGGFLWGLEGVLLGGVVSYLIILWFWKPIFLFRQGFKISVIQYWKSLFGYYLIIAVSAIFSWVIVSRCTFINPFDSIFDWILYACIAGVLFVLPMFGLMYFYKPGMKALVERVRAKFIRS